MAVSIKVLTLNCWGVHVGAKKRTERMTAIGKELAKAEYDIVLLQEIWMQSDYEKLCAMILTTMPYTHYFRSGVIGSGLCIFSKHPILETQGFPFTLNGYAHRFYHGDWFGRKSVGLAKILINGVRANFYVTHLHAEYSGSSREYHGHRVSQAFEMSQIIKYTSEGCDIAVVAGDFNYNLNEVGYKVIRYNGNLLDALDTQRKPVEDESETMTCDRHDNCFTEARRRAAKDPGSRLDHILYRYNTGYTVNCESCTLAMRCIPGEDYNYSDHEGVAAHLVIRKNITGMGVTRDTAEVEKHLTDCLPVLDGAVSKVTSDRVFYAISMFLCVVALVYTADIGTSWTLGGAVLGVVRTVLTVMIAFFLWMVIINARVELATLHATRHDINNLLRSNPT